MAAHPRDYAWSSFRAHADGQKDAAVSDHPLYRALGRSAADRQQAYRELFRAKLSTEFVEALRAATNGGWALGDDRFKRQIAKMAGRRADKLPLGSPPAKRTGKRKIRLL
jgi:putative transposase